MPHINVWDLGRVRTITSVLVRHGFSQLVRLAGLEVEGEPVDVKLPLARRLRMVLSDLGPTFVKLGQVLSVRPDIVPPDVIEELSLLQDQVTPAPFEAVKTILEEELGGPLSERFSYFEETPLASASIAQVHRATLLDGRTVAVKVQRPGIEAAIRSDLHILYSMASLLVGRLELPGLYSPEDIVTEFDTALSTELDFLQEARAARRFAANFEDHPDITAPEIHLEYSSRRVLVMELLDGESLSALLGRGGSGRRLDEAESKVVMHRVMEATWLQVFEHGFFHGDPHPGNIMRLADGRVAFLDFGLTGRITREMQDVVMTIFTGLIFQDADTVAMTLFRAGATESAVDLKGFRSEIQRLMAKYHGASLRDLGAQSTLTELVGVAARYRIRLVPEYAVLARAVSLIDGLARELIPDVDIVQEVRPYAMRLMGQRLSPERISGDAVRGLQQAQIALQDVPLQFNQLLLDLERGNIRLSTIDPESAELRRVIHWAGLRLAIALCAASTVLSGAILMSVWAPAPLGIPLMALVGMGMLMGGGVLFSALVVHILVAERIHPREWKRRVIALLRFFTNSSRE
ncbi:MAG: ubiquinone biosynthesis protein [Myxococcota bacterium]|jgi:ubiquinone biosynthesis protein